MRQSDPDPNIKLSLIYKQRPLDVLLNNESL